MSILMSKYGSVCKLGIRIGMRVSLGMVVRYEGKHEVRHGIGMRMDMVFRHKGRHEDGHEGRHEDGHEGRHEGGDGENA